ncbi:MAG: cytochrome c3 family protein [Nitrospirota bacterium]
MIGLLIATLLLATAGPASAADSYDAVINSPHNFFARSEFPIGRLVCTGCHADEMAAPIPDAAPPSDGGLVSEGEAPPPPLWQRDAAAYSVFSTTRPDDASNACLACHDGVLGTEIHQTVGDAKRFDHPSNVVYPRRANGKFVPAEPTVNQYRYWSIPDLRDGNLILPTGPTSSRLALSAQTDAAAQGAHLVRTSQGMVQCDSCHNPHDNASAPFLRAPAQDLCFICHDR